jgi:tyrosyl-tRNA synthetase|tara:strand:+ start:618 stop:1853 length:1236 start_codon:yes stop_codon:yes gene_type:complete
MTLLEELELRGFIHQCTDSNKLNSTLKDELITFYIGFDCTAKSLHVGSLMQIMMMRIFQKYGHTPIVLIGEGTTKIGDPSGKDQSRKMLSSEDIKLNSKNLTKVFDIYLDNTLKNKPIYSNNADWLENINYINFLRDYGKHFTINKMLSFDSVKLRLDREQSLSFVEFNYMILQAYDYLELHNRHNCKLQIGGSDQWGNIVNGIDLIRRDSSKEVYGLTTPLLTNAKNEKMGKTVDGAVWLNKDMLTPYDYWQFWRNVDDRDVFRFLKLFTDLNIAEINDLEDKKDLDINNVKVLLANAATEMLHGKDNSILSEKTANDVFKNEGSSENLPSINVKFDKNIDIYLNEQIVEVGFTSSKSEARKLIKNSGVKINRVLVSDELKMLSINDFDKNKELLVSVGKKKHFIIKLLD